MKKVLIPMTSHKTLGNTDQANGTYAPELTHVAKVFIDNGIDFDLATVTGEQPPMYGTDMENDPVNSEILSSTLFQDKLAAILSVDAINISHYDAVFYPGGFGLLSDLFEDEKFAALSANLYENGGLIGAVCHGPAALLPITLSNGEALISDKVVTGFTREEEIDFGTIEHIPFLLEEALARKARQYTKVQPWQELVIEDNRVITGQNPTSAHAVGEAIAKLLLN